MHLLQHSFIEQIETAWKRGEGVKDVPFFNILKSLADQSYPEERAIRVAQ